MEDKKIKIEVNEISPETKKSFSSRFLVAVIMVLVVVPTIIIGNYLYFFVMLASAIIATHELIRAPQSLDTRFKTVIYVASYLMMGLMIYWIFLKNNIQEYLALKEFGLESTYKFSLNNSFDSVDVSLNTYFVSIAFLFFVCILDNKFSISDAFYFAVMIFIVSMGFQCSYFLRYYPFSNFDNKTLVDTSTPLFKYWQSAELLIFVLLGTVLNDVGAYLVGICFGKHKMCEHISPKKTWEGFVGGILSSVVISFLFGIIFASINLPMTSFLTIDRWYNILILSIIIPFVGTLGDLVFSAIKRHYNIKDYGTILKAHGGILDRLDSAMFTFIASSLLIILMSQNWLIS